MWKITLMITVWLFMTTIFIAQSYLDGRYIKVGLIMLFPGVINVFLIWDLLRTRKRFLGK